MKKKSLIITTLIFIAFIFTASSCYTSKRGIVPCPSYSKAKAPSSVMFLENVKPA